MFIILNLTNYQLLEYQLFFDLIQNLDEIIFCDNFILVPKILIYNPFIILGSKSPKNNYLN